MNTDLIITFTDEQRKTFVDCEKVLDDNEEPFLASIRALKTISDGQLYRIKGYESFEAFLADRQVKIARGKKRAGQLIRHMSIVDTLAQQPNIKVLPTNERQTRELKFSDPLELAAAWLGAQTASGEDQPSGTWVKSSVETLNEAKVMGSVDLNTGGNAPVTASNYTLSAVQKETERVQRMRDHIKAGRKRSKPVAVFEGKFTNRWLEESDKIYATLSVDNAMTLELFDTLYVQGPVRIVVYAIEVPK